MARLAKGDVIRIPAGALIGWIGVSGVLNGVSMLTADTPSLFIGIASAIFGLVFVAIGAVMAFGWILAK